MHEKIDLVKNLETENFSVLIDQNTNRVRQKVMIKNQGIFNWLKITFNQSKFWKFEFFEKL